MNKFATDNSLWMMFSKYLQLRLLERELFYADPTSSPQKIIDTDYFIRLYVGKLIAIDYARFVKEFPKISPIRRF